MSNINLFNEKIEGQIINSQKFESLIKKYHIEQNRKSLLQELELNAIEHIKNSANKRKKQDRLADIDAKKQLIPAKQVLSQADIKKLPDWVKHNIEKAYILGDSQKVISIDGKKYHIDNPLNDLPGGEWTFFLRSVINTRYGTTGEDGYAHNVRKIHPSPKPPQLMAEIVRFFTKKNEWVLDYFMGVGGTLLGASIENRRAIGFDLNDEYLDAYKQATRQLELSEQITVAGDSISFLKTNKISELTKGEPISLICIDPPYGDMMSRKKTGEKKKNKAMDATPFTESQHDLGNMPKSEFLKQLKLSVELASNFLRHKGHVIIFAKDFQPSGKETGLLHADIINCINEIDCMSYLGMKIWADESVNLYPYGYPYSFVANQLHQYILVFRKGK